MSRGRIDKSGILTFRPRVVSVIRRKVAEVQQQEEYKEIDYMASNFEDIAVLEDETSTSRILGNQKEVLDDGRKKYKELEDNSRKETLVPGVNLFKKVFMELSEEDTDFINRRGGHVIRKIEQITGASIERSGHVTVNEKAFIRGSEGAVMKAINIIKKEEVILNKDQVSFLLRDGGKRMRSIEKDSNALIVVKGKFEDDMQPVTFIGTELAINIAKAILEEAAIIQTKIMLDREVGFLLRGGGKLIDEIENEAEVSVEFQGNRGDKGRATDVIGSKEAVVKAWAMIQNVLNKFEK